MKSAYEIHVISNTHWDREWLYNFQETRMMLVEFFDKLLDILDTEPRYSSYLLDSQSAPLDDYLEVRPEQRDRIKKHVSSGRLLVGPWYTCPEEFNVNGESLVRNLLYGHRVAGEFGDAMKVGYSPFSYGQVSQMPQVYGGFGIDSILFYHGVTHDEVPNEFLFEGADGTRLFASQMSSFARYNFYFHVYRPLVYGTTIDQREYTWHEGGLPFHLCTEAHCMGHHFLLEPVKHFYRSRLGSCLDRLLEMESKTATTKYIGFMQGHDSSAPDLAELRIIEEGRRLVGRNKMFHSSLPELVENVKGAARDLKVLRGERRTPKPMGARIHLFSDVTSSRTRLKRLNAGAEHALQRWAEPYAAVAWCLGREYPSQLLDIAWKYLLKCHAHDSIAGSGIDQIEEDMSYRLRQVINISDGLTRRSLEHIQSRIDNADADKADVLLTVFNPSPCPRSEVVTAVVDLPRTSGYEEFSLVEAERKRSVPVQIVSRHPHSAVVRHLEDAPLEMACERAKFHFDARDIPPLGYTTYRLERKRQRSHSRGNLVSAQNTMENEHLRVHINANGTLTVAHKETGVVFDGLHYFEDRGEAGHAWMHIEPAFDRVLTSRGFPVTVAQEENGPLLASYRIDYRMSVPSGLDEGGGDFRARLDGRDNASRRTEDVRELIITSRVTLKKGARSVAITTCFDNTCRNHRLRVMFPTRIKAETCSVESAFDVVERKIEPRPDSAWFEAVNPTHPMQRFVDVSDGKVGLAIINDGLREYEVTGDPERAIAMTLLRAFEVSLTTVSKRWERHPEMILSQSPGAHEFRYLIYPHVGNWDEAHVYSEAERLALPVEVAQVGPHGGDMPKRHSFLKVEPQNIILSALKRSVDGGSLVLRLFNPTSSRFDAKITLFKRIRSAQLVDLEEKPLRELPSRGKSLRVDVDSKKIVTVTLKLC